MLQEQNKNLSFPSHNPSPDVKQCRAAAPAGGTGPAPQGKLHVPLQIQPKTLLQQKSTRFTFLPRCQQCLGVSLAGNCSAPGSELGFGTASTSTRGMQDPSLCAWISRWVKAQVPSVLVPL